MEARAPDRTTVAAFGAAVLIGGANFVAVKLSNEELEPLYGAALRFTTAALLLFAMSALLRWPIPRGKAAVGAAIYGLLGFGFAYGFLYFALVGLSPGVVSMVTASVPLVTLVFAVAHGQEQYTLRGVIGGLLAVAGIAVLSAPSFTGEVRPLYFASALLGVAAIAESTVVIKRFPRAHPFTTNAIGMAAGALLLVVASLLFRDEWMVPQMTQTWLVLTWLVLAGSIALFALFIYVVVRWTASATVYALTLMPVVAVTLGVFLADEEVTVELVAGGALVTAAVYIGALRRDPQVTTKPAQALPEPPTADT